MKDRITFCACKAKGADITHPPFGSEINCMITDNSLISERDVIYRYLDVESYLYLIQYRRFPVTRIIAWPDSFEGTKYEFLKNARHVPSVDKERIFASCWSLQTEDRRLYQTDRAFSRALAEVERNGSASMWSTYCPRGGVRLKTTVEKILALAEKVANLHLVHHGKVYYEAADEWGESFQRPNPLEALLHKRISFRHETEYRFIFEGPDPSSERYFIPVDDFYDTFDEVLVAPSVPAMRWLSRTIYNLSVKHTIHFPDRTTVNSKRGKQYCRISQLHGMISEVVGTVSNE